MKIKEIEVNDYKAFYGKHKIEIGKKNTFIYGENGSGKSSLYFALKDFFQSSIENIDMEAVENIFIDEENKGENYIKVVFRPDKDDRNRDGVYRLTSNTKNTNSTADTSIRDANSLKSFLTYKHLLDIHHLKMEDEIDLFNLLVKGVLKHFKYTLTDGRELGEMWGDIEYLIKKNTDRNYNLSRKKRDVNQALEKFNAAFGQLFKEPETDNPNPEYILGHSAPILNEFDHGLEIKLRYTEATPKSDYKSIERDHVRVDLKYCGKDIPKPHLFLNEARLSSIAISIYLGMIKRHPQLRKCKILFLDDIFIGLDISNRMPLLKILEDHFPEYQVFITTYDKPWYEYARGFLDKSKWKTIEFYAQEVNGGFTIPNIKDGQNLIVKAREHLSNSDYKACAVYARSAYEKTIMDYCARKWRKVPYKKEKRLYSSNDFWNEMKDDLLEATKNKIEGFRFLYYNNLSHHNPEANPLRGELGDAIDAVEELKNELRAL